VLVVLRADDHRGRQALPAGVSRSAVPRATLHGVVFDIFVASALAHGFSDVRCTFEEASRVPETIADRSPPPMPTITTKDGVEIFYKDWANQPIVFSHGWPLSADDWTPRCCSS